MANAGCIDGVIDQSGADLSSIPLEDDQVYLNLTGFGDFIIQCSSVSIYSDITALTEQLIATNEFSASRVVMYLSSFMVFFIIGASTGHIARLMKRT